jgi:hypothetical protein
VRRRKGMSKRLLMLGFLLSLTGWILVGCGPGPAEEVVVPDTVLRARDAALSFIAERYAAQAPALGLTWTAENVTPGWPDKPVAGHVDYRFTAEKWLVRVGYGVLPLEQTIYRVVVTNQATPFEWKGEVDALGKVTELSGP